MITLAIALADKWNGNMIGFAYIAAIIADAYWLSRLGGIFQ